MTTEKTQHPHKSREREKGERILSDGSKWGKSKKIKEWSAKIQVGVKITVKQAKRWIPTCNECLKAF